LEPKDRRRGKGFSPRPVSPAPRRLSSRHSRLVLRPAAVA
jgi:hypothetical protein